MIRVADLYCGAGGVAHALKSIEDDHPVEFHVVGVDIEDHSALYPGDEFVQADASSTGVPLRADAFDVVWASPPCTAYSAVSPAAYGSREEAMQQNPTIPEIGVYDAVQRLCADDGCWVVENVPGAEQHMHDPVPVDGGGFGADYQMRRLLDASFNIPRLTWDRRSGLASDPSAEISAPISARTADRCTLAVKKAKGLPEEWPVRRSLVRSAIPLEYVQYAMRYCPTVDGVPLPDSVTAEQTTLDEVSAP